MLRRARISYALAALPWAAAAPAYAHAPLAEAQNGDWAQIVRDTVHANPGLQSLSPTDAAAFCPNFSTLDAEGRSEFWSQFLVILADDESRGDPTRTHWSIYDRAMHRPTFRRGLFQISKEAAHSRHYQCDLDAGDLNSPQVNSACAVRILEENLSAGGEISSARYWPTLAHADRRARLARTIAETAPCASSAEGQK